MKRILTILLLGSAAVMHAQTRTVTTDADGNLKQDLTIPSERTLTINGSIVGTPLAFNSASGWQSALGLAIGSDVQAWDADLADLADGTLTGSKVQEAGLVFPGVVSTGTQSFLGAKTFSSNATLNGTNNTAPNQTAAGASSVMTRSLIDSRSGRRVWSYLEADKTFALSSTTLQDTDLTITLEPGWWMVELVAVFRNGGTTSGAKVEITTVSGTAAWKGGFRTNIVANSSSLFYPHDVDAFAFGPPAGAAAPLDGHFTKATIQVTATTVLRVRGAQLNAGGAGNEAIMKAGSWIRAEQ